MAGEKINIYNMTEFSLAFVNETVTVLSFKSFG